MREGDWQKSPQKKGIRDKKIEMKEDRELEGGTEDLDEKDVVENEHNEDIKKQNST
jgi:hypothetical protein